MNAYELAGVTFTYNGPPVLEIEELTIPANRITALAGTNGSGKTTLLHILAFLEEPTGGEIRFFGERCTSAGSAARRLRAGLLLQSPYLFHASVAENVAWALRIRGVSATERRQRTVAALERAGLAGFERRAARELSGGESQRLALARLLALQPEVLLLDEPTNHLDRETRVRIEELLREWVDEQGGTVILTTHDIAQAHRLGATVWQLEAGQASLGEPGNVFRGRVHPERPGFFATGRIDLRVSAPMEGTSCVRIGPREVVLARETVESSARNQLKGRVVGAELSGPGEIRVTVDCGEPLVAIITQESWERLGLTVGRGVVARFKASAVRPC